MRGDNTTALYAVDYETAICWDLSQLALAHASDQGNTLEVQHLAERVPL